MVTVALHITIRPWLFDHSTKTYSWAMNLVVIQAFLKNGLEYPLFYSIWHKPENKGEGLTKLDLAKQMLLMLRESVKCRLWAAMDRWYLCKDFFVFLESNQFDWVTCQKTSGLVSIAIPNIYMKQPYTVTNRKGKQVTKQRYVQIAAVAAMRSMRLKEDELSTNVES
jgi:hypothetical protein